MRPPRNCYLPESPSRTNTNRFDPLVDYADSDDEMVDTDDHSNHSAHSDGISPNPIPEGSFADVVAGVQNLDAQMQPSPQSSTGPPPLPSKFHNLYPGGTSSAKSQDDPSLHKGLKRGTPHVEGNFPSFLYIEWYPTVAEEMQLNQVISFLKARIPDVESLLNSDNKARLPLHISLSPTLGLTAIQRYPFMQSLEASIGTSNIRPFRVTFDGLNWFPNFDGSRWFLVVRLIRPPKNELNRLLARCNDVGKEFGQPSLYDQNFVTECHVAERMMVQLTLGLLPQEPESSSSAKRPKLQSSSSGAAFANPNPTPLPQTPLPEPKSQDSKFHISIAWRLKAPDKEALRITRAIQGDQYTDVQGISIEVKEIKVKTGNVIREVELPEGAMVEDSIF